MSDPYPDTTTESGTVEVRIIRHGRFIGHELCESEDQALLAVRAWSEFDGVDCEVVDLAAAPPDDEPDTGVYEEEADDYPEELDVDRAADAAMRFGD